MKALGKAAISALLLSACSSGAFAVEGGSGAYFLGSRDFGAGFVPPPGFYQTNEFVYYSGSVPQLAIGGVAVSNADLDVFIYKPTVTYVPDFSIAGARVGISVLLPYAMPDMDFTGSIFTPPIAGSLSDSETGFGDLTVTPLIGWDNGMWHFSFAGTMFFPTGEYSTASIDVPSRTVDVLSISKNKFAFDPTVGVTYLNPATGFEVSGALGLTISANNDATDYQTAPELHFEGTIAQHFPSGLALGLTGYAYQQLDDDSGSGADSFKAVTGAKSLQARIFGIGPAVAWNTKIGNVGITTKAKYMYEFGGKRRFEGHLVSGTLGFSW